MTKYKIKSNLSERQVESDVARYFGWCSPTGARPFRLMDVSEQMTGADRKYDVGTAIYIQFKKSEGLKSVHDVAPSTRANRSALEDVREFRERRGLYQDPTLYFQLREKAPTATDLQHNVLLSYENPPWSRGIYVAPLFLDKTKYDTALFSSAGRFIDDPFYYRQFNPLHKRYVTQYYFEFSPFLRAHISIPPHERVDSHQHYYAYSEAGCDLSWHSPEVMDEGPSRLSDFLGSVVDRVIREPESLRPLADLAKTLSRTSSDLGFAREAVNGNDEPLEVLRRLGDWLRDTHRIRQFLLLADSRQLQDMVGGR